MVISGLNPETIDKYRQVSIFSGSKFNFLIISDTHPFSIFYNNCDKSELRVLGPFLFYLRVSWTVCVAIHLHLHLQIMGISKATC